MGLDKCKMTCIHPYSVIEYFHCPEILCAPAKQTVSKVTRQPSEWEKIIANETTDKGLISKICKQLIQLKTNNQKNKQPNQKVGKRPKQTFLQKGHTDG